MSEQSLQSKITRWLKDQGAYVIKVRAAPGVPVGCPDIIALYNERWATIEVKRATNAPFQTGQQATLQHLKKMNTFVYVANPVNWQQIQDDLTARFF